MVSNRLFYEASPFFVTCPGGGEPWHNKGWCSQTTTLNSVSIATCPRTDGVLCSANVLLCDEIILIDIHRSTKELEDTSILKQNCKICVYTFMQTSPLSLHSICLYLRIVFFAMESNCLGRWWMFWTCQINSFEKENCRSFFFCHSHLSTSSPCLPRQQL